MGVVLTVSRFEGKMSDKDLAEISEVFRTLAGWRDELTARGEIADESAKETG